MQPVDHVLLKIPDYPIVIKHPMDLGTIKTKLENGQYSSPRDFEHDVNLVFRNATVYNKPGNVVHDMCKVLQKVFDRLFLPVKKAMLKREPKPKPVPVPKPKPAPKPAKKAAPKKRQPKPGRKFAPRKKKEPAGKKRTAAPSVPRRRPRPRIRSRAEGAEIAELRKELAAIKEWQLQQMSQKPKPKAKPKPKKRAPPKSKTLTEAEKRALGTQIKMLPGEKLTRVLKIISEKMPISHNNGQSEIVIDMEALDTDTLRALQKYVRQQSSARNKKNPAQMEEMARKMSQGTQERIDFLKQSLERQKMQSDSSSDSSFDTDSDSGSEEILHLGGSSSATYY